MVGALVPDGPLHPEQFLLGLVAGLGVAMLAGRRPGRWAALSAVAVAAVVWLRLGNVVVEGYSSRSDTGRAMALTLLAAGLATACPVSMATLLPGVIAGCAVIWAFVPDTEVPLIVGAVLVGAAVRPPSTGVSRWSGLLVSLPVAAAVTGSLGRPDRLEPALLLGGAMLVLTSGVFYWTRDRWTARQRAGTPTTVAPAATSSMTTAPAPTIAP